MKRAYYLETIADFIQADSHTIQGHLSTNSEGTVEQDQIHAWDTQIKLLQHILPEFKGKIYFEFSIPRMGRRIDVVLVIDAVVFVLEFKAGTDSFSSYAIDQVWDYGLDLKNFHETSHHCTVAPILISTEAKTFPFTIATTPQNDNLLYPIQVGSNSLLEAIKEILAFADTGNIDPDEWEQGRYCPTPTIIEAALALYRGHSVKEISRSDAGESNLHEATEAI